MTLHHVFDYERMGEYRFEELPKGYVFTVSINPYTGRVFLDFEKHESSTEIGLDVMRRIMEGCDFLERNGSFDPLRDYARLSETGELSEMLADAARENITAFEGRKRESLQVVASGQESKESDLKEVV